MSHGYKFSDDLETNVNHMHLGGIDEALRESGTRCANFVACILQGTGFLSLCSSLKPRCSCLPIWSCAKPIATNDASPISHHKANRKKMQCRSYKSTMVAADLGLVILSGIARAQVQNRP